MTTITLLGTNSSFPIEAFFNDAGVQSSVLVSSSATTVEFNNPDTGISTTLTGTGFVFTNGVPTAGIITSMEMFSNNGATLEGTLTQLNWSIVAFVAALDAVSLSDFQPLADLFNGNGGITVDGSSASSGLDMFDLLPSDLFSLITQPVTATGSVGDDFLSGGIGNDILIGGDGNDVLIGMAGNDTLLAGDGIDTILYDQSDITSGVFVNLFTGASAGQSNGMSFAHTFSDVEVVRGSQGGDDTLISGNGIDGNLNGLGGDDSIVGADGADTLIGNTGNDTLIAGAGNDNIVANQGLDFILGENGDDRIDAGIDADSVLGGNGNDTIFGGGGFDTLRGGEGDDTVVGGDGRDSVFLGNGNDLFADNTQAGPNGADTVLAGSGNDTIGGGAGNDRFEGQDGNDLIFGRLGNDVLFGGGQNDTIEGGDGNDTVAGSNGADRGFLGNGNDRWFDNAQVQFGNDFVVGGNGDDWIQAGGGNDTLAGGAGADTFVLAANINDDVITDYDVGVDDLDINANLWNGPLDQARLDALTSVQNGNLVFDFENGDSLTLNGVSSTAGLLDDIELL